MAEHVKRSVLPIYLIGVVWLVFGIQFSLHQLWDYILCGVVSVIVFIIAKAIFPDRHFRLPEQEQKAAEAPERQEPKQQQSSTGNPELDALIQERERAISEMRRLNDSIEDPVLSKQIDHLEEVTGKIIDEVVQKPEKLPQIRRFLNYFLPTTLKLLNAYDRMDATGISGENIDSTKQKVESMLDTIVKAFDQQLDALFSNEAMDISTDITVMEQLLTREGFGQKKTDTEDEASIHLEL